MVTSTAMAAPYIPQIALYRRWLEDKRGLSFPDYEAMRQWSVTDLDTFWQSIWDYFNLQSPTPHSAVLADWRKAYWRQNLPRLAAIKAKADPGNVFRHAQSV